ncbi:hypothetical protein BVRB_5g118220 [Beta vulgaris subsp. vulgaris]|nr:hypothetical protein BVRB_5g118220 [Beta vulgaris subsp. vulgaris]
MITSTSRTSTTTNISLSCIFTLYLISYFISSNSSEAAPSSTLRTALLALAGLSLLSIVLIVVARTTMVAWITVLVLLAFSGKRRRVLVHDGRKITCDVAMHLIKVMVNERQFLSVIGAAVLSLLAMAQVTRV